MVSSRDGAKGRPASARPSRDYIITKLREVVDTVQIDLGDYEVVRVLQAYISSYTSNYIQGLMLVIARHKEQDNMGLIANLALRYSIANNDIKVSVKSAIRVYEPLLTNLVKLTENLDVTYIFK
jgi:hypothetical protein